MAKARSGKTSSRKTDPAGAPSSALSADTRCLLIRASAGTGKTYQLSSRYIMLLRTTGPETILASTFTRKAAGEIMERILRRLAEGALIPEKLAELGAAIGPPDLTRNECLEILTRLTGSLHRMRIGTLDSFFAKLVGSHALELGIPPGWRIADESELRTRRAAALQAVLEEGNVEAMSEVVHWLAKGQASRSVTELLDAAVGKMYGAYLSAPPSAWDRMPDPKFLSAAEKAALLIDIEALTFPDSKMGTTRDSDLEKFRAGTWEELLDKGLFGKILAGETTFNRKEIPKEAVRLYRRLIEQVRAECLAPWRSQTLATRRLLDDYDRLYRQSKRADLSLEFNDLTQLLGASDRNLTTDGIAFRLDARIRHLLLDEFQDTSPNQWKVLRPIAEEVCRDRQGSFFCVGDRKQAIYGWRGGEAAIFDTIERQLSGLRDQTLDMSRRSSPAVIDAVNLVMRNLTQHDNLEEYSGLLNDWSDAFPEHTTVRTDLAGYVRLSVVAEPSLESDRKVAKADKVEVLLKKVAGEIAGFRRSVPTATIGVLTRTNEMVARIVAILNENGIEASEEGGNPITDSAAVAAILSLLTLADQPGDTVARYHVVHSPLATVYGIDPQLDDAEARKLALRVRHDLLNFGYGGFVHRLLGPLAPFCSPREFRRLGQLASIGDDFDTSKPTLRPREFVDHVRIQKRDAPSPAVVRVMNIHQSKGLEFDIVVLPELDKDLIQPPSYFALTDEAGGDPVLVCPARNKGIVGLVGGDPAAARDQTYHRAMTEALCLLYVAMTRAVHGLYMYVLPNGKEKHHRKTFAGPVCAALAPDQRAESATVIWEHGDPDWFQSISQKPAATPAPPSAEVAVELETLQFLPPRRDRDYPRVAPSQKQESQAFPVSSLFAGTRLGSLDKGTLFHRWCEGIQWLTGESPVLEPKLPVDLGFRPESEWRMLVEEFRTELMRPSVRAIFDPGMRLVRLTGTASSSRDCDLEVRNEFGFTLLQNGSVVNGTIDRLVLCRQGDRLIAAEIIDFKTDAVSVEKSLLAERVRQYRPQLEAYRAAVARLFGLSEDRIAARLVFLAIGEVVDV